MKSCFEIDISSKKKKKNFNTFSNIQLIQHVTHNYISYQGSMKQKTIYDEICLKSCLKNPEHFLETLQLHVITRWKVLNDFL